ncbi:MAG TPA: 1,6-anhydro-N-acetylmuramyl-L-alanine amidase AmpD [Nevskiaceae bacterium]|nr:1,6-anhydro-N-acetylmuramyl-L-alanine amidase AmpD [Nevskiaceae bacterium]
MSAKTQIPPSGSRAGWLPRVRVRPSPNCDERPDADDVSLLVIHAISLPPDRFGGRWVEDFFLNRLDISAHAYFETIRTLRVSAHLFIDRCGRVTQFVPLHRRAWHAGVSSFGGRERCNDFSIGIELEGCDTQPFTAAQYRRLATAARAIMRAYPRITPARIAGHSDIAPGRKTDPGPHFDWARFRRELRSSRPPVRRA